MRWIRGSSSWSSFFPSLNAPVKRYHIPKELRAKGILPPRTPSVSSKVALAMGTAFVGFSLWGIQNSRQLNNETHNKTKKGKKGIKSGGSRAPQVHFAEFASVEIEGEPYMTPKDFIESMVKNRPSLKLSPRKNYTPSDAREINASLPSVREGNVLSAIGSEGLFSFEDYLFLFSLLTKSQSSFQAAFKLLDQNANQEIELGEFRSFCLMTTKRRLARDKIRSSLSVLFFGEKGEQRLSWKDFCTFLDNFQKEILFLEFGMYLPRHGNTISEINFAKIILRHSDFNNEVYEEYIARLELRLHPIQRKGISFEDFRVFNRLLNHIDDLCIAVRMINFAGIPMDKKEFSRAVNVCLQGDVLSDHMVDVIFRIFDLEGDSLLSYDEFLSVAKRMQLRKRRPDYLKKSKIEKFKHCVREELAQDFYGPS